MTTQELLPIITAMTTQELLPIIYSDRSRFIDYQRCPTSRYLQYSWGGTGLRRLRATIPLIVGSGVHAGLGEMLEQIMKLGDVPGAWSRIDIDQSVAAALKPYDDEVKHRGLDIELGEDSQWVVSEMRALIEALVRAYQVAPNGLQALLEQYHILEVEREDVWEGFTQLGLLDGGNRIDFQARADGLMQERSSGDLYVLSFKTASAFDYRQENENRHDVQGLSEAAVIERRLNYWWQLIHERNAQTPLEALVSHLAPSGGLPASAAPFGNVPVMLRDLDSPPRIMGVQMVYLVKGQRSKPEDEGGRYVTQSSLIHPWRKEGITEAEWAWRYKWSGPDTWPDSGKLRGHTLGKGWKRVDIWDEPGGVQDWIAQLSSGEVQGELGDPFESVVTMPLPYFRQDRDVQDWIEQAQNQEAKVAQDHQLLEQFRKNQPELLRTMINALATPHRRSCDWPSKCQFVEICYGDTSMYLSPLSTGLYEIRIPHHESELKQMEATANAAGAAKGAE